MSAVATERGPATAGSTRETLARALNAPETLPALLVCAMTAAALAFNLRLGLSFAEPDGEMYGPLLFALPIYALCASRAVGRTLGEIVLYLSLYWAFGHATTRLSYLGYATGFPLQDEAFARADAFLGFDWMAWQVFLHAHPRLLAGLASAYASHMPQAVTAIVLLAVFDPRRGNGFLLTALTLAGVATLAISTLVPALGPAKSFGYPYPWEPVVAALRGAGPSAPLPLMGIVSFPSFHTAMAIAYTCAYRRLKILLAPAAVLNLLMLAAVPFSGDHYVCDMLGGAAVALCALAVAHRAQRGGLAASRAGAQRLSNA